MNIYDQNMMGMGGNPNPARSAHNQMRANMDANRGWPYGPSPAGNFRGWPAQQNANPNPYQVWPDTSQLPPGVYGLTGDQGQDPYSQSLLGMGGHLNPARAAHNQMRAGADATRAWPYGPSPTWGGWGGQAQGMGGVPNQGGNPYDQGLLSMGGHLNPARQAHNAMRMNTQQGLGWPYGPSPTWSGWGGSLLGGK